jgi:two-component system sensor kinase FixL
MQPPAADELAAILATTVDAIIVIDDRGLIESFNAAATTIFGYSEAEAIGCPVTMLMDEPHRSAHDQYLQHYLATGDARIIGLGRELDAKHKDGHRIPIYLAVSEVAARGRRRFTGIIRDLTEQHATRAALAEQRERLAHVGRLSSMGEMTASIAHEINQPLTAIAMYAQAGIKMLESGAPNMDRLRDALDKLSTQSLRAGAVIERIQRFAKSQESQRELTDINDLLLDLVKLAETDVRLYDMELSLNLMPDLPPVRVDPVQVQQVALNLIRNAIDATVEIDGAYGRRIDLRTCARTTEDSHEILVEVRDQGPGVPAEKAELVFAPFHTTKKTGMGMGLSICRSIITEHGGVLNFRNNGDKMPAVPEAHGATFFFTLPVGGEQDD